MGGPAVRIRRSRALVITMEAGGVVGFDFLRQTRGPLSPLAVALLAALDDWLPPARLFSPDAGGEARAELARELLALLDLGFAIAEGSPAAELDGRLERDWHWGALAGHYHFGIKDPDYRGPAEVFFYVSNQVATAPPVPLYTRNDGCAEVVELPPPALAGGLLGVMYRRRSYRGFDAERPLPLEALRDCLFAGFGIVGFAETSVPGEGPLPFTMTPSGGARNPFEAYVVARSVHGLTPGVYHYCGLDNSLGRLAGAPPDLPALLGGQDWFAAAGAVVLLVAHFDRCMWKYPHPGGFRVVLLEAGHIAQNLLLAATAHDLAAAPTCAISDRTAEAACGLDRITQAAVHAVALGVRSQQPSSADVVAIQANPRFAP